MYFVLMGEWNPPGYVIHTRGRFFNPPKRKHELKRAKSHRCEVNLLGTFVCNFSTFFMVSQRDSV